MLPYGCYFKQSTGYLYLNMFGDRNDDDTDRISLCSKPLFTFHAPTRSLELATAALGPGNFTAKFTQPLAKSSETGSGSKNGHPSAKKTHAMSRTLSAMRATVGISHVRGFASHGRGGRVTRTIRPSNRGGARPCPAPQPVALGIDPALPFVLWCHPWDPSLQLKPPP